MTTFVDCAPDEPLGTAAHYRVTLVPSGIFGLGTQFQYQVTELYNDMARYTGMAFPVSNNPAAAGQRAASFDVKIQSTASNATVGALSQKLDNYQGLSLASIERIDAKRDGSKQRATDRTATQGAESKKQEASGIVNRLVGAAKDAAGGVAGTVSDVKWIVLGVVALVVVFAAWKATRK